MKIVDPADIPKSTALEKALAASHHRMRYINAIQNVCCVLQVILGLPITSLRPGSPKNYTLGEHKEDKTGRERRTLSGTKGIASVLELLAMDGYQ
jgi:hypothetical protein